MTYYPDLSPCGYFDRQGLNLSPYLRAVGWLDGAHAFAHGTVSREVLYKLADLKDKSWEPPIYFCGKHICEVCTTEPPWTRCRGFRNIFVPADGFLYVSPEMLLHYITEHTYLPPAAFCDAVLACPPPEYDSYFRAIARNFPMVELRPWV